MKTSLLFIFSLALSISLQAQITYTTSTTPVTCPGGNDGTATITSISGGFPFISSTKGLLISEIFTDVAGSDSPFEFVELVATRPINFGTNPFTIIFSNNGVATANGWIHGTNKTYAFEITTGSVTPGEVIYVGGTSMLPLTNQFRVINTGTTGGDGGIGTAVAAGVLGNGGTSVDGIAVFAGPIPSIGVSTVPIDAIFFGDNIGSAYVNSFNGYELPMNDYYSGGKLDTVSYFIDTPASMQDLYIKANFGVYNTSSNTFSEPRQWIVTSTFTDTATSILLDGLYNVSWSNGCTSVYNPNLMGGPYTFTIADLFGLTAGNVNVADGPNVDLNATADDTLACEGQFIILSASGADTLIWSTGDTSLTSNATVDFDTTFYVTGIDTVSGCTYTDSVFIDVNQYPSVSFSLANDTVCNDGGDITLIGSPSGGVFSGSGVSGTNLDPSGLSGLNSVDYIYTDENGCSDLVTENYFVVNCLGIEDEDDPQINIYPNPATDFVWIKTNVEGLKFSIMDLSGKVVNMGTLSNNNKLDIQPLNSGIYILSLQSKDLSKQVRLIKK